MGSSIGYGERFGGQSDPREPMIGRLIIGIIVMIILILVLISCSGHLCPTYAQTDPKSFELFIPEDSTVMTWAPTIMMDVNRAAEYYHNANKLAELEKEFPAIAIQIEELEKLHNDKDSINAEIIARLAEADSLGQEQLSTCEDKSRAILKEAKRQDARADKAEEALFETQKKLSLWKKIGVGSSGAALLLLIIFL